MITTYVGIGSNLQRHKHIEAAIDELCRLGLRSTFVDYL